VSEQFQKSIKKWKTKTNTVGTVPKTNKKWKTKTNTVGTVPKVNKKNGKQKPTLSEQFQKPINKMENKNQHCRNSSKNQ
jgi:hypothetical protein